MTRAGSAAPWFAVHAAVVVWLTWPLAQHAGTDLPNTWVGCQFDLLQMGWALAHQAKALVTVPWALAEANIYHPTPHALWYGDPGFGALPWFMPVYLLTDNPILASNVTFLLSIALTAWTLHLVVHRWTHSHAGGFVAGWTFVTTPWVLWTWVPAAPNNAVLQYSPLIVLLASIPVLTARRLAVLLLLVILQGLTAIYVAIPMFLVLGVIALIRLLRGNRDAAFKLILLAGIASLVLTVANAGFMLVRAENPNILWQTFWPPEETAPPELPWGLFSPIAPMRVHLAVLLLVVGGALSFVFEHPHRLEETRGWQHAALWSVIALWASLPPRVTAFGHTVSIDAITLAGWLPFLRGAERLGPVGLIGLALLAGLAVPALGRRLSTFASSTIAREWAPRVVALAVAVIIHRQYVNTTPGGAYPLSAAISASSPLMDELRGESGPLLELPAATPAQHARAMYRSIYHRRPILNGYDGYWPAGFPERMAVAGRLPDPAALHELRRQTGLTSVLVHAGDFGWKERELCDDLASSQSPRAIAFCSKDHGAAERDAWLALARDADRKDLVLVARRGLDLLFAVGP